MNVRKLILALPAAALLALAGCAGSQASTREDAAAPSTTQQGMQGMAAMCPMQVQGTKVEASSTDNGAALTFTTQGDVAELRRRVTAMAERHNALQGAAGSSCPLHKGQAGACDCPSQAAGPGQGGSGCPCGEPGGAAHANCPMHGKGMHGGMGMPASRVTTEEVPGGIRLVFTPEDASQLEALRESVRHHAEQMSSGRCPMMRAAPARGG